MIRYRCDGCGLDLESNGANHYILKIEAFAAAGKLEFTQQDLNRDHEAEIRRVIADLKNHSPDDIEDQVYRSLRYDLCPACHRRFLALPLAGLSQPHTAGE
ncbi:MAG: hypothetical protein JXQ75_04185 [Phycisphaerae bacterium]|nr:hypothetical protein [Phycisphaerae bacterium]